MSNRYVVTGGAGFIGSGLVRALLAAGEDRVTVVDNLLSGHAGNLDEVRDRVDFHRVDIRDYEALLATFTDSEIVIHLAAIPSVPRSISEPVPSHDVNINGTFNVFQAARESGIRRVVYAASSSAYGDTEVLPKVETMVPHPKSPYALQKLVGEYYGSVFAECFGLEVVSLRFFNVYGPRQDPNSPYSGVLSIFMKCLLEGTAPTIYGDGEQSRDFTYVEDVANLVIKASLANNVSGNVYNAGNGNRYTLNYIWSVLQQSVLQKSVLQQSVLQHNAGVTIAAKYGPARTGDVRHSQADTTAAVADLGHHPQFSLEEGLQRTFEWYKQASRIEASVR
ncbi:MAG: SDR family oxidoreductase [Bryobacteraceae bacterium]